MEVHELSLGQGRPALEPPAQSGVADQPPPRHQVGDGGEAPGKITAVLGEKRSPL